jgi:uncharacterized Fe-S radical SAM superfamily protein PflX
MIYNFYKIYHHVKKIYKLFIIFIQFKPLYKGLRMNEMNRKVINETIDEIKEIIKKKSTEQFENKAKLIIKLSTILLMEKSK